MMVPNWMLPVKASGDTLVRESTLTSEFLTLYFNLPGPFHSSMLQED